MRMKVSASAPTPRFFYCLLPSSAAFLTSRLRSCHRRVSRPIKSSISSACAMSYLSLAIGAVRWLQSMSAVPVFVPVLVTAIVAVIMSREESAPLAYIAGSLGTLIGADLTNLGKVRGLGAPVASIGGAGTFDGIFLTGILAVLLASLYARPRAARVG